MKRSSLFATTLHAVIGLAGLGLTPIARAADRPNFVFIYADDQRWDTLGVVQREQGDRARFPWLESPNLDRLAAEGVRFRNAFVVTSLCAPSRAAFLTGRYGHMNGVIDNHTHFPVDSVTHATLLRSAGYRAGYVGKWHMGDQRGQRPGFDFSASFIGQGVYFDCPIEVNGVPTKSTGWVDDVSTDYAQRFITENRGGPFVLVVGYKTCHGPFTPPERTAADYEGQEARATPNLNVRAIYNREPGGDAPGRKPNRAGAAKTGAAQTGAVKTNLGMMRGLRALDENVGKILATLDELRLAENTVVIYSSDNGYYLGEHGLGDKRTAYDESLRVPMLLRYPKLGARGVTIDRLVLNIDLAPTLLDFAGLTAPATMQGRSWKPLLAGDARQADWRGAFFYEYFREGRRGAPTLTAVRTDAAKLIRYPGHDDWTELFDLAADPYETKNLFADAQAATLRAALESEYDRQAKAVEYRVPDYADEKTVPPPAKPHQAWVLDYRFDQDTDSRVIDASGAGNNGVAQGAKLTTTSDGQHAREFDGHSVIRVKKSPSLDPAEKPWTVEATFRAEAPDGVVLARGGQTTGYALAIVEGRPTFTCRDGGSFKAVAGKESVVGRRVVATARMTSGARLQLWIDGQRVDETGLPGLISRDPRDDMDIGDDSGSPVLDHKPPAFRGIIERVRIFNGEAPAP